MEGASAICPRWVATEKCRMGKPILGAVGCVPHLMCGFGRYLWDRRILSGGSIRKFSVW